MILLSLTVGVLADGDRTGALHPHGGTCAAVKPFPWCEREQLRWCVVAGWNMSSRKNRCVANPLESAITTPSERILKECHSLYVDSEHGK